MKTLIALVSLLVGMAIPVSAYYMSTARSESVTVSPTVGPPTSTVKSDPICDTHPEKCIPFIVYR